MRYEFSAYQEESGNRSGDITLYPINSSSDYQAALQTKELINDLNKRRDSDHQLGYFTLYRYRNYGWKTVVSREKL